jgi:hypothetical protein
MHDGHEHGGGHSHTHEHGQAVSPEKTKALLAYMLTHNREHAQELVQLRTQLEALGKEEAAQLLNDAISDYDRGNEKLEAVIDAAEQ